jgi:hypothetical protein
MSSCATSLRARVVRAVTPAVCAAISPSGTISV